MTRRASSSTSSSAPLSSTAPSAPRARRRRPRTAATARSMSGSGSERVDEHPRHVLVDGQEEIKNQIEQQAVPVLRRGDGHARLDQEKHRGDTAASSSAGREPACRPRRRHLREPRERAGARVAATGTAGNGRREPCRPPASSRPAAGTAGQGRREPACRPRRRHIREPHERAGARGRRTATAASPAGHAACCESAAASLARCGRSGARVAAAGTAGNGRSAMGRWRE